jgi:hypothetical protein
MKRQIGEPYVFLLPQVWETNVYLWMYFFLFATLGTIYVIVVVC